MTNKFLRGLAGSTAGLALLSAGALAADLPTKKAPEAPLPPLVPAINWTGFYAGLEGGVGWDGTIIYVGPWNKGFGDTGVFGGPLVAYNYQINQVVLGVQAAYNFSNVRGSSYAYPYGVNASVYGFGSVDGRLGYAFGPALIYAIGGGAIGDIHHSISPIWSYGSYGYSSTETGWDIGGGLEYAFTNNISGRVEVRHYNFGTKSYSDYAFGYSPFYGVAYNKDKQTLSTVLVGLTYKFGDVFAPAPVQTRY